MSTSGNQTDKVTESLQMSDGCLLLAAEVTGANRVGNHHASDNTTSPHQHLSMQLSQPQFLSIPLYGPVADSSSSLYS